MVAFATLALICSHRHRGVGDDGRGDERALGGALGLVTDDTVAWSPVADTLAMVTAAGVELQPSDGGPSRLLANAEGASSLAWHPG